LNFTVYRSFQPLQVYSSEPKLSGLQSGPLATAKQHATEERIAPSASRSWCLTWLSESARNYKAFGLRLPLQETSFKLQLSSLEAVGFVTPNQHAACHARTDQAFGLRLPVPNVAF
jgi:hypothetical protein